ncbi:MAG: Ribosomal RNA small subunit methyltransferase I [Parcubacteria group bacterium GW2011_GWC2_39_14]|nr:MAG: Ribosomal RNA small subunit methyltransferase I [Parcubacteria group bacterium GW2011_GWC2_39_14]KKR55347.1 MAG: Ribosomal RNA small subunit methyltransferase I [Parcubacteria group bacterium GW2011_GWA2_40_23]
MLYIVATPIGNLEDITFRALRTLKEVDVILCEDTRQTMKLLSHFQFSKHLISLHQHTSDEKMLALLKQYENIAYVSDAGTPGISDPGNKLVAKAVELNLPVCPIPGVAAVTTALSISGFQTDHFMFLGFMPLRGRTKIFNLIKDSDVTIAFYESPHRIIKTLEALKPIVGNRLFCVCRELTKKFETIYRGTVDEVLPEISKKVKGEFTIIISK